MTNSANPLQQFFRQPAIYLRLPSNGEFWPEGSLEMPPNQEIPVYPMTAIDEITYRTPDALYNGSAVISVVQSCIPAIKNAWYIPNIDLNAILIAIRIASNGHDLEVSSKCPSCSHEQDYSADLRTMLGNLSKPDFATPIRNGDLEIYFQPLDFEAQNQVNIKQFEQQRTIVLLNSSTDMPEPDKMKLLQDTLISLTQITTDALSRSIAAIKTPDALVTDRAFIHEWLENCDRTLFNSLRDHIIQLRESTDVQAMDLSCPECSHAYKQNIVLDSASFFEFAS
jgi:hypothetical protein